MKAIHVWNGNYHHCWALFEQANECHLFDPYRKPSLLEFHTLVSSLYFTFCRQTRNQQNGYWFCDINAIGYDDLKEKKEQKLLGSTNKIGFYLFCSFFCKPILFSYNIRLTMMESISHYYVPLFLFNKKAFQGTKILATCDLRFNKYKMEKIFKYNHNRDWLKYFI